MAKEKQSGKIVTVIEVPENVEATSSGNTMTVRGPIGEVKREFKQHRVQIRIENKKIILESGRETKKDKKISGALAAHIKNMIRGSQQIHTYTLKICSGHFPMNVSVTGNKFTIKNFLGEKVPRALELKEGVAVRIEGEIIHVTSINKELAGQVSADVEQLTRRPGFDTRVFQDGIYITNKDGKELK